MTSMSKHLSMLVVLSLLTASAPARAAIDPVSVTGFISTAYTFYQQFKNLLGSGGKGPDLAARLNQVKDAIVNELVTQRNVTWKRDARDTFDNFALLGVRASNDPDNYRLWSVTWDKARSTINHFAEIIAVYPSHQPSLTNDDLATAYQLAPAFNALSAVATGLNKMKGEGNITPGFPSQWLAYHQSMLTVMHTDYRLIGAEMAGCRRGFNPSRNYYTSGAYYAFSHDSDPSYHYSGLRSGSVHWSILRTYFTPYNTGSSAQLAAAYSRFRNDPNVTVVRNGMLSILKVGGGVSPTYDSSTAAPAQGYMTDPWVPDGACPTWVGLGYNKFPGVPRSTREARAYPYQP
jgi:hypothetical protein